MARVIRARYENGVLKPLEKLDLREGEEVRVVVLPKEFSELIEEIEIEAKEDVNKILREGRKRWVRWYSTQA
ncbi:MAG: hypothetical protein B6U85_04230 [Desulfurococcales archaeon ex4484_42]|nr:MAG: hypothetical protein B6U85_04230 [Desulfurococcales archaeon ex4484_42]